MTWLSFSLVIIVPFFASIITFFSGFGLSTILLPAFTILFGVEVAIAATAIVHFLNNMFKIFLVGKKAEISIVLKFGVPAVLAAFFGAWLLTVLSYQKKIFEYSLGKKSFEIDPLHLVIGALMIFFAIVEVLPQLAKMKISKKYLPLGGILSGFFGGLSGHQGAFRSAFLIKMGLSKEAFIATGIIIACAVDFIRLLIYGLRIQSSWAMDQYANLLGLAVLSAWIGAWIGRKVLSMATYKAIQRIVAILLILFGILIASGMI
jgi:uncharacterized protein